MENTIVKKIEKLSVLHDKIAPAIIKEKDVKLGLRNADGTGVIVGITTKGSVVGYDSSVRDKDGKVKPAEGKLYYCNYDVAKIIETLEKEKRFGFEEVAYLLLTGELPSIYDLDKFKRELAKRQTLTKSERKIIMEEVVNVNQMFALHSVISHLSRCDPSAESTRIEDVSNQSINLIAKFPTIVANNYNVLKFSKGADLKIFRPKAELNMAQNFLYLLRGEMPDDDEARMFDAALVLHADHGGGNNSTFTVRSVSSSGANTYMAIAAGLASLSGHLHGGANESVDTMMKIMKKKVKRLDSDKQIGDFLKKVLEGKEGDGSGKLFGFGHAVYTLSDPRAVILKRYARELAHKKNAMEEFELYDRVESVAKRILDERRGKITCTNVDFYSGLLYRLMGIPRELYTPIFAMARVVGWSAHRIEQIIQGKILRPAYITAQFEENEYTSFDERKHRSIPNVKLKSALEKAGNPLKK